MEFVLGSCSCFNIEIAYLNFTFCGAYTPSFFAFRGKKLKIHENELSLSGSRCWHLRWVPPPLAGGNFLNFI